MTAKKNLQESEMWAARHGALVDKKFRSFLTDSEQAELLRLGALLDEADAKFYEAAETRLRETFDAAASSRPESERSPHRRGPGRPKDLARTSWRPPAE
jgi:hypothetical protein